MNHKATRLRYRAIDTARGLALGIMVMSHAYRLMAGSVGFRQVDEPVWQLSLLIANATPSLFFLCFGAMLGVIYTDKRRSYDLRSHGWALFKRGVLVFVTYKLLVVLELRARGAPGPRVLAGLLYRTLAAWVEVLDFYAVVLLLSPLLIWLWRRLPSAVKLLTPVALAWAFVTIQATPWPYEWSVQQALLVGRLPFNTFPILPYLIPTILGLLIGENLKTLSADAGRWPVVGLCFAAALTLVVVWWASPEGGDRAGLIGIVSHKLKHPPRLSYLAFTTATALVLLGGCVATQGLRLEAPSIKNPLEVLGRQSLFVFNFHYVAIFGVGGLMLGWIARLAGGQALAYAFTVLGLSIVGSALWERKPW